MTLDSLLARLRLIWDLAKFSKIFQLLHRAPKLVECTCLDARSTTRHSSFQKKIQPPDAHRLPHGGFTHPSSRRLGLPRVWDLVKFSKILQLLHRAPKLVECTSLDVGNALRQCHIFQLGDVVRRLDLPLTREVHHGQWNPP